MSSSRVCWRSRLALCLTLLLVTGHWWDAMCMPDATTPRPVPRRDADYPPPKSVALLTRLGVECIAETGVSPSAIKRFSDEDIFEDDYKLKCYMSCLFRLTNVTDDNGELHLGKLLDTIPIEYEDIMLKMGARCTKPKGKDQCERAFWFHKCWKKSDPVYYYLV
uniref:Odorant binding protein 2 n=1 Tax=Anopheles sinensis TaxID=74873 RepID=A0A8E8W515_ANOSI|nr:odorant binding protein 2 [Anopheles sinensis]